MQAAEDDFRSAVAHAIQAGELLIEAKAQVAHGEWLPWLEANCPLSERQARNYMRLARNRQRVADLPTIRNAVALLAEPRSGAYDALSGVLIALAQDPVVRAEMVRRGKLANSPMINAEGIRRGMAAFQDGSREALGAISSRELWDLADLCEIANARRPHKQGRTMTAESARVETDQAEGPQEVRGYPFAILRRRGSHGPGRLVDRVGLDRGGSSRRRSRDSRPHPRQGAKRGRGRPMRGSTRRRGSTWTASGRPRTPRRAGASRGPRADSGPRRRRSAT